MELVAKELRLSPKGLKTFLEINNRFVEFMDYKIVIKSHLDCFKWWDIYVYRYSKRK